MPAFAGHTTGRAGFPHPAFRQTSWQAHGGGFGALDELRHSEFPEDAAPGKRARSLSRLLVPLGEETPDAIADISIDGPIRANVGSIAEIRRPTRQQAVQFPAYLRPRAFVARHQKIADLVLDALHAFPGWTCAWILLSAVCGERRPQRVAEEVEAFHAGVLHRGLRFVEGEPEPGHRRSCPRQRLFCVTAAEDDEVIGVVDQMGAERHATSS